MTSIIRARGARLMGVLTVLAAVAAQTCVAFASDFNAQPEPPGCRLVGLPAGQVRAAVTSRADSIR